MLQPLRTDELDHDLHVCKGTGNIMYGNQNQYDLIKMTQKMTTIPPCNHSRWSKSKDDGHWIGCPARLCRRSRCGHASDLKSKVPINYQNIFKKNKTFEKKNTNQSNQVATPSYSNTDRAANLVVSTSMTTAWKSFASVRSPWRQMNQSTVCWGQSLPSWAKTDFWVNRFFSAISSKILAGLFWCWIWLSW